MHTEIEITEDQLAIDWTLTEEDIQFINNNSKHGIKFAALLCHLRAYGRFIGKDDVLSFTAVSYLAKQLGQPFSTMPVFSNTPHSYIQREKIRQYLGYSEFNEVESLKLEEWLVSQLRKETLDKRRLIELTTNHLKSCRIVLPSPITLGRIVSQKVNQAIEGFHGSIAETLALKNELNFII